MQSLSRFDFEQTGNVKYVFNVYVLAFLLVPVHTQRSQPYLFSIVSAQLRLSLLMALFLQQQTSTTSMYRVSVHCALCMCAVLAQNTETGETETAYRCF